MDSLDSDNIQLSFSEIYDKLLEHEELILTIPADQEQALRKGLAWTKAKQNNKLKDAGIQPDAATLSFQVIKKPDQEDKVDIHILLSKKASIKVFDVKLPDTEL